MVIVFGHIWYLKTRGKRDRTWKTRGGGGGRYHSFLQGSYRNNIVNHGLKFNLRVLFITAVFMYILKAHFSFNCLMFIFTMVIWVTQFQNELMVEIYSKSLDRTIGKVLLIKFS